MNELINERKNSLYELGTLFHIPGTDFFSPVSQGIVEPDASWSLFRSASAVLPSLSIGGMCMAHT